MELPFSESAGVTRIDLGSWFGSASRDSGVLAEEGEGEGVEEKEKERVRSMDGWSLASSLGLGTEGERLEEVKREVECV